MFPLCVVICFLLLLLRAIEPTPATQPKVALPHPPLPLTPLFPPSPQGHVSCQASEALGQATLKGLRHCCHSRHDTDGSHVAMKVKRHLLTVTHYTRNFCSGEKGSCCQGATYQIIQLRESIGLSCFWR